MKKAKGSSGKTHPEAIVTGVNFPVFSREEYAERLRRTRERMAEQGIDLLYVTQPSNMCYLHGYACTWYHAAATSAWPPAAGTAIHVDCNRMIHFDYPDEIGTLEATSVTEDRRIFPGSQGVESNAEFLVTQLKAEGWLGGRVGFEFWSFVPNRAVSERLEVVLVAGGAREVVDGSFIVREVRRIKSQKEIEYIEQGVQLADLAVRTAADVARVGVTENEVYAEALRAMLLAGGEMQGINQGFKIGPASGLHHAYSNLRQIEPGDVARVDFCGVVNRYHGNVARGYLFREPTPTDLEAYRISAEAFDIVREVARPGTHVRELNKSLQEHFESRDAWGRDRVFYIGGYELGIAFPPDWVGEWMFEAVGGVAPGVIEAGMVSNFESVILYEDDYGKACETSNIDTIVYGEEATRTLSSLPYEPIAIL